MQFVMRCAAHGIQNVIKLAWAADAEAQRITKAVVNEVAKFLRSSSRFEANFRSKAKEAGDIVTAISNFDFAPQRFSSKERPLTRMVLFADAVVTCLGLEVVSPVNAKRAQWAGKILSE